MSKRNIKLKTTALFLFGAIFILAGCDNKNQEQAKNQEQDKTQIQTMEQKKDGTGDSTNKSEGGNPPTGMTEACSGKVESDSCEVAMPSKEGETGETKKITGSCKKSGQSEVLSCMPTNMPQGGPRGEMMPTEK
ncbi:MAG: hypothetical protein WC682_02550 [Parcubacteria group bacterium]|jgi:hypothetical protein